MTRPLAACKPRETAPPPSTAPASAAAAGDEVVMDPRTGKGVFTPLYLDGYAPPPYRLTGGRATFDALCFSPAALAGGRGFDADGLLTAPASGRKCLFWWLEVTYDEGATRHEVYKGDAGVPILVDVGDRLVKVEPSAARAGGEPSSVNTYRAGEEPDTGGLVPAVLFPATTWREWLLEPGTAHRVAVEKSGDGFTFTFTAP
jgi:hypothetical protein